MLFLSLVSTPSFLENLWMQVSKGAKIRNRYNQVSQELSFVQFYLALTKAHTHTTSFYCSQICTAKNEYLI